MLGAQYSRVAAAAALKTTDDHRLTGGVVATCINIKLDYLH
jgi:hypothetical protein